MDKGGLLPIGKAAEYLGVSVDTLRRWDASGKLPAQVLTDENRIGKVWRDLDVAACGYGGLCSDASYPERDTSIAIDFTGVVSLSPSWADEFFSGLEGLFGVRPTFLPSENPSVKATLDIPYGP